MEDEKFSEKKTCKDKCANVLRQNLIVLLTVLGVGVGLLIGFLVAPHDPSPSAVLWMGMFITVNSEIFARFLFSRIALKDIFARFKNRDFGMICLHQ